MRSAIVLGLLAGAAIALVGCGGQGGDASADAPAPATVTGVASAAPEAGRDLSVRDLVPLLTRYGVGPNQSSIDVIYTPSLFFEVTGLTVPAELNSRPTLAFILQESIHEGDLVSDPPPVFLELEDGDRVQPYSAKVTAEDPHHRTVRLLFPLPSGWSDSSRAVGSGKVLRLVVPLDDGTVSAGNTFEWRLPIDFGGGVDERKEG